MVVHRANADGSGRVDGCGELVDDATFLSAIQDNGHCQGGAPNKDGVPLRRAAGRKGRATRQSGALGCSGC